MALQLLPMELGDFDLILPNLWFPLPETETEAETAVQKHEAATTRSRYDFLRDPTGRWFKIVDATAKELIAYARWHIYNDEIGYQWQRDSQSYGPDVPVLSDKELKGWPRPKDDQSELAALFLKTFREERQRNIGGQKFIVLDTLVTSFKHQRRGAGKLLMDQFTKEADELALPILIEGSPAGLKLYHAIGGVDTGEVIEIPQPSGEMYIRHVMIRQPSSKS